MITRLTALLLAFAGFVLFPVLALAQEVGAELPPVDQVPGWMPTLVAILTVAGMILRALKPFLNEHVEAMKLSKVDDLVFDVTADLAENSAKDIRQRIADGKLSKEEGHALLANLAKIAIDSIVARVGEHYLGKETEAIVAAKVERAAAALKARETALGN
jgi:hypothetical protein